MNIKRMQKLLPRFQQIRVIDRGALIGDIEVQVMGFTLREGKITLHVLHWDRTGESQAEWRKHRRRPTTRRRELLTWKEPRDTPLQSTRRLLVNGCDYAVEMAESEGFLNEWTGVTLELLAMMQAGWQGKPLQSVPLEQMLYTKIHLRGVFDALPFDEIRSMEMVYGESLDTIAVKKPMVLEVGKRYPRAFSFAGGEHGRCVFYIHAVRLEDIWPELDEQLAAGRRRGSPDASILDRMQAGAEAICPRGMCLPVVVYECPEEWRLQFYDRAALRASPQSFGGADILFRYSDEQEGNGPHGMPLHSCMVETAVAPDAVRLDLELLRAYRQIPLKTLQVI